MDEAYVAVLCAAPAERTFAFGDGLNDDLDQWFATLDASDRETAMSLGLEVNWNQTLFPVSIADL